MIKEEQCDLVTAAWFFRTRCEQIYKGTFMSDCMGDSSLNTEKTSCEIKAAVREAECGLLQLAPAAKSFVSGVADDNTDCTDGALREINDIGKATKCVTHPKLAWETLLYMTGDAEGSRCSFTTFAAVVMQAMPTDEGVVDITLPACTAQSANNPVMLVGNADASHYLSVEAFCNRKVCEGSLANAGLMNGNADNNADGFCTAVAHGNFCRASCAQGYRKRPGTDFDFRCDILGRWDGNLICDPVACDSDTPGVLGGVPGVTMTNYVGGHTEDGVAFTEKSLMCSGNYGDECDYACDDGYTKRDDAPARTCSGVVDDVSWTDDLMNDEVAQPQRAFLTAAGTGAFSGGACDPKTCTTTGVCAGTTTTDSCDVTCPDGEFLMSETAEGYVCSPTGFLSGAVCSSLPLSAISATTRSSGSNAAGDMVDMAHGYGDVNYNHPNFKINAPEGPAGESPVGFSSASSGFRPDSVFDRDLRTSWISHLTVIDVNSPQWLEFSFKEAPTVPIIAMSITPSEGQSKYFAKDIVVWGSYYGEAQFLDVPGLNHDQVQGLMLAPEQVAGGPASYVPSAPVNFFEKKLYVGTAVADAADLGGTAGGDTWPGYFRVLDDPAAGIGGTTDVTTYLRGGLIQSNKGSYGVPSVSDKKTTMVFPFDRAEAMAPDSNTDKYLKTFRVYVTGTELDATHVRNAVQIADLSLMTASPNYVSTPEVDGPGGTHNLVFAKRGGGDANWDGAAVGKTDGPSGYFCSNTNGYDGNSQGAISFQACAQACAGASAANGDPDCHAFNYQLGVSSDNSDSECFTFNGVAPGAIVNYMSGNNVADNRNSNFDATKACYLAV
eukprot:SAG11_NODE_2268_length_3600_cov_2.423593_1_plen_835_part_00